MDKREYYKGHTIEMQALQKTGDSEKMLFVVLERDKEIFSIIEQISRTEYHRMDRDEITVLLEKAGIKRVKNMLDAQNYQRGREYRFFEAK